MNYLLTSTKPALGNGGNQPGLQIFDEEALAKIEAEKLLKRGHTDVTLWKQVAQPIVEQTITWGEIS